MMVRICTLLIVSAFLLASSFAASLPDSVQQKPNPRFLLGFDARNSFVADQKARIGGVRVGIELKSRYRFGLGVYATDPPVAKKVIINIPNRPDPVHVTAVIRLNYLAPFFEYVWYQSKHWELSSPVVLGLGSISVEIDRSDSPTVRQVNGLALLGEVAVAGHYKIFPWVGIGSGVGYRKMFASPIVSKNFDSIIYILKLKLFPEPIIRAIFPRKQKAPIR